MKAHVLLKLAIVIAAGIALYLYFDHTRGVAAATSEYNRIVELMNQQQHQEAIDALERLLPTAPPDMQQRIRTDIARQCAIIGDDPGLPIVESARWYRKAVEHDATVLTEQQQQVLKIIPPE